MTTETKRVKARFYLRSGAAIDALVRTAVPRIRIPYCDSAADVIRDPEIPYVPVFPYRVFELESFAHGRAIYRESTTKRGGKF